MKKVCGILWGLSIWMSCGHGLPSKELNVVSHHVAKESEMKSRKDWLVLAKQDKIEFSKNFFNALNPETMDLVDIFYHSDAKFIDPIGRHDGVVSIKNYYRSIYGPVTEIHFSFDEPFMSKDQLALPWKMTFCSSKLNRGEPIVVDGLSRIKFHPETHQAIYHRDYFDMGEMVYEKVPVLGFFIRWIKGRLKTE
jgi:hypothetical protein